MVRLVFFIYVWPNRYTGRQIPTESTEFIFIATRAEPNTDVQSEFDRVYVVSDAVQSKLLCRLLSCDGDLIHQPSIVLKLFTSDIKSITLVPILNLNRIDKRFQLHQGPKTMDVYGLSWLIFYLITVDQSTICLQTALAWSIWYSMGSHFEWQTIDGWSPITWR